LRNQPLSWPLGRVQSVSRQYPEVDEREHMRLADTEQVAERQTHLSLYHYRPPAFAIITRSRSRSSFRSRSGNWSPSAHLSAATEWTSHTPVTMAARSIFFDAHNDSLPHERFLQTHLILNFSRFWPSGWPTTSTSTSTSRGTCEKFERVVEHRCEQIVRIESRAPVPIL
jgi:hypothetical protein